MAISRAQLLKELVPGLNALFGLEYDSYENEHEEIYSVNSSDRAFEEELKLSGFGAAVVKDEGESISYDNAQEHYVARWNHQTVALGFSITEEAIEDNLYDSLSARYTKALARSMAHTKQVKAASPINNGMPSGSFTSGDGVTLFNTAHPLVSGGTNSNTPGTAHDLNETSLEADIIAISEFTDERGLLIAARPQKLIVPPELMFVCTRILQSELKTGTNNNDINAIRVMGSVPEGYRVNHFFTDADAYIITTSINKDDGMKMFVRTPVATATEGDFETGNMKYKARERYSFGVADPLGVYGSPGA